jgi:glycosyltransferase 2 family protein
MHISRPLISILKLLFTILLLVWVFQSIDVSKISGDLSGFNWKSMALLLVVCWLGQLLCSERWRIFAAALKMHGSYRSFVQMYFAGMFFNIGLPSLIGGDAVKAYILSRKSGKPLHAGLASVLQDRVAGLITLLIYGSIAILLFPLSWRGFPLWMMYLLSWLAVSIALGLVLKGEGLYRRFLIPGSRTFPQRVLRMIAEFHQALGNCDIQKGALFRVVLYSFINSGLVLWIFQQVTAAAGYKVQIIPFSALYPLVTLATMLPVTLSGLGVRECFYVEALSLLGVQRNVALCISLATSALLLLCNLGGVVGLPGIPSELRRRAFDLQENAGSPDTVEHRISSKNDVS